MSYRDALIQSRTFGEVGTYFLFKIENLLLQNRREVINTKASAGTQRLPRLVGLTKAIEMMLVLL